MPELCGLVVVGPAVVGRGGLGRPCCSVGPWLAGPVPQPDVLKATPTNPVLTTTFYSKKQPRLRIKTKCYHLLLLDRNVQTVSPLATGPPELL